MRRSSVACGLVLFATLLAGCHRALYDGFGAKFGCQGCGHRYWGAYVEDPPRPEPCDCYGNWTGPCGGDNCECSRGSSYTARRAERLHFWAARLKGPALFGKAACCEDDGCGECTQCSHEAGTPSCHEGGCGEAGCGEPGCGHGAGGLAVFGEQRTPVAARSPQRNVQPVSRTTVVAASPAQSHGGCNCGRH